MDHIRELVTTTLDRLGLGNAKPLGECLLCSERYYVGIRFSFEGVSAIWLENSDLVRFVDDAGKLLKVARLTPNLNVAKEAA
jgi:hypothetical protein